MILTQPRFTEWHSPASVEDMLLAVKDFHPLVHSILKLYNSIHLFVQYTPANFQDRKATDVKLYNLMKREPLDHFTRGKAVLIGDAAHPMLPSKSTVLPPQSRINKKKPQPDIGRETAHAQGGGLGVEEAGALEVLFAGLTDRHGVDERLKLYEETMHDHCAITQILSNGAMHDQDAMRDRVQKLYKGSTPLPPAHEIRFSEGYRDIFSRFNVLEVASKALEKWKIERGKNSRYIAYPMIVESIV